MTRSEKRREARKMNKIENKMFTFKEVEAICKESVKLLEMEYDILYSTCLATSLNAEPINFGKKRVCRVLELFFGQVDDVKHGRLKEESIIEKAEELGLLMKRTNGTLEVYIDPTCKFEDKGDDKYGK